MLGLDVHCYFAEVQIGANPCGCRDASLPQYIADHSSCQFVCRDSVGRQISRYVHEHFVYRIHMDVFRSDIVEIDFVDARAVLDVVGHARRSGDIVHFPVRMSLQFNV